MCLRLRDVDHSSSTSSSNSESSTSCSNAHPLCSNSSNTCSLSSLLRDPSNCTNSIPFFFRAIYMGSESNQYPNVLKHLRPLTENQDVPVLDGSTLRIRSKLIPDKIQCVQNVIDFCTRMPHLFCIEFHFRIFKEVIICAYQILPRIQTTACWTRDRILYDNRT